MLYSLYILKDGKDGKSRSREVGIATTNSDGSLCLHFDVAIPLSLIHISEPTRPY